MQAFVAGFEHFRGELPWTEEMLLEAVQILKCQLRERFEAYGEIRPEAYMFANYDPFVEARQRALFRIYCPWKFDVDGKNMFATYMRRMARITKSAGVAFVSEVWTSMGNLGAMVLQAQQLNRVEELMISLSSKQKPKMWHAKILRPKDEKPRLDTWEQLPEAMETGGRFTDILRQDN